MKTLIDEQPILIAEKIVAHDCPKQAKASKKKRTAQKKTADVKLSANIGEEIKGLRKAKRWTLDRLAKEAGCSTGLLSQLERGKSTPSIKTVQKISSALGVYISWFMPQSEQSCPEELGVIVRREARRCLSYSEGMKDVLLTPSLSRELELLESTIAPGAGSGDEPYFHNGEEAGLLLKGQLSLWIDGKIFNLNEGDCFSFESLKPHKYWNPGDIDTVVIWAITPPSF